MDIPACVTSAAGPPMVLNLRLAHAYDTSLNLTHAKLELNLDLVHL